MRSFSQWRSVSVCLLLAGVLDCGSMSNSSNADDTAAGPNASGDFGTTGAGGSNASTGAADIQAAGSGGGAPVVAAPEMDVQKAFQAPVATARYVWSANPMTGRVAFIDSQTFQVKTVSAGEGPTYIAAIPTAADGTGDRAIVINIFSQDATYLNNVGDQLQQKTFQIASGANAWAISPDGRFAIAWTDVSRIVQPDSTQGFQQISIIDLTTANAPMQAPIRSVGFRPSSISFSASPPRAFAVTQDGITVIDLTTAGNPQVLKTIKVTDSTTAQQPDSGVATSDAGPNGDAATPSEAAAQSDIPPPAVVSGSASVSITPKGDYAIVRTEGSPMVTVINLATEDRWSWTLDGPVTGLDLADTGTSAVAVIRGSGRVAVLPVPGAPDSTFPDFPINGAIVGSVIIAPQGKTALLFTNVIQTEDSLTVLHLDDPNASYNVIGLHAPVLSVFAAPTGDSAIVIHNSFKGAAFQKPGAFSVVPLSGALSPVIQETDAPPFSVAISPKGDRAIIPARSDQGNVYLTYIAHMDTEVVDRYELASPPTAAGFVSQTGQAFIAQDHPEGRVTFIDGTTGQVRTITGFELGASVIEWGPHTDGGTP